MAKKQKGGKGKKKIDHMSKKVWYDVLAPEPFTHKNVGKTIINKTVGTRYQEQMIKGRVFEVSAGDLMHEEKQYGHQLVKLKIQCTKANTAYTTWYGMRFTNDKMGSIVRKWHSKIEYTHDVTTADGFKLRVFVVAFTKRKNAQLKKTAYAQTHQIHQMHQLMKEQIEKHYGPVTLKEVASKCLHNYAGLDIQKQCSQIYGLQNSFIYKVKVLSSPKFELSKLSEFYPSESDISEFK